MNRKTELFLDQYRTLEAAVSARYDLRNSDSAVGFLERRSEYRNIKSELSYCREVRNLLTHNPKVDQRYAVEPTDEMIALLDRVIERVQNPQKARHIWVPIDQVVCRTMADPVRPAMAEMQEKLYSHIPILHNGTVVGVFSENTLLSFLLDDSNCRIGPQVTFAELGKYLPLDRHRAESFRFVGRETTVSEIEDLFSEAEKQSDRIGLIFVTHSGKKTEKLQGIISAWEVAGID